jgi:hypothetical protein
MPWSVQIGPVLDAFDVVPHAVAIDDAAAGRLGDRQHTAVDVIGNAGEHPLWRRAEALRPVFANEVVIGADAAGRHDDRLRLELERANGRARAFAAALHIRRFENIAADADDCRAGFYQLVDAMAELERH